MFWHFPSLKIHKTSWNQVPGAFPPNWWWPLYELIGQHDSGLQKIGFPLGFFDALGFNFVFATWQKHSVGTTLQASLSPPVLLKCFVCGGGIAMSCVRMRRNGKPRCKVLYPCGLGTHLEVMRLWLQHLLLLMFMSFVFSDHWISLIFSVLQRKNHSALRCLWACLDLWNQR